MSGDSVSELLGWLRSKGVWAEQKTAISTNEQLLQHLATVAPSEMLAAVLSEQQGFVLLLQQLLQHEQAIYNFSCFSKPQPPVPAVVGVLHALSDAATPAQLQELLQSLLQLIQPGGNDTIAEAAVLALTALHFKRRASPDNSRADVSMLLYSKLHQVLVAKALEHSSSKVVQWAVKITLHWDVHRPWRDGDPVSRQEWCALKQHMFQELKRGSSWAAHWYYLALNFQKYEHDAADIGVLLAAAAVELEALRQQQTQQQQQPAGSSAGQQSVQPPFALATACCLTQAAGGRREEYYGPSQYAIMTSQCSPVVALWLFGPEGRARPAATPAQAAAASEIVLQATRQLLAMLKQALDGNRASAADAMAGALFHLLKTAAGSTGLLASDWLLPGLACIRQPTAYESTGWLFKKLVEAAPEPLQEQLIAPLLQDLNSSDSTVAQAAAGCLKDATQAAQRLDRGWNRCLAHDPYWELLQLAQNSSNEAVAEAADLAVVSAWQEFEGPTGELKGYLVLSVEQQVAAMKQGSVRAATMLYQLANHGECGCRLLLPHLQDLMAAAGSEAPTQAAALAAIITLYQRDYTGKVSQDLQGALDQNVLLWVAKDGLFGSYGGACTLSAPEEDIDADSDADVESDLDSWSESEGSSSSYDGGYEWEGPAAGTASEASQGSDAEPDDAAEAPAAAAAAAVQPAWRAPGTIDWELTLQMKAQQAAHALRAEAERLQLPDSPRAAVHDTVNAGKLPACLVSHLSSEFTLNPSSSQGKQQQRVNRKILVHLAETVPNVLLAAAIQKGWLGTILDWDVSLRHLCVGSVVPKLVKAATADVLQQLVSVLLPRLASSTEPAALAAAVQQAQAYICESGASDTYKRPPKHLPGILAQQQHWQLLRQLLQHGDAAVAHVAVQLISMVLASPSPATQENVDVLMTLQQQVQFALDGDISAAKLVSYISRKWDWHQGQTGANCLNLLLPLLPRVRLAAISHSSTQLVALQTLQLCCLRCEGKQEVIQANYRWLFRLIRPGSSITADSVDIATVAAQLIQQLATPDASRKLLYAGSYAQQLLQAILQYTAAQQASAAALRSKLEDCCSALMRAIMTFCREQDGWATVARHIPEVLQIMLQCEEDIAQPAGEIILWCLDDSVFEQLLQPQHVDTLVKILTTQTVEVRFQAYDALSCMSGNDGDCSLLATAQNLTGLFEALESSLVSGKHEDMSLPEQVLRLIAHVLHHICSAGESQAVAQQLSSLVTAQHIQLLAHMASRGADAVRNAVGALALIASNSTLEIKLLLGPYKQALHQAVAFVEEKEAKARQDYDQYEPQGAANERDPQAEWLYAAFLNSEGLREAVEEQVKAIVDAVDDAVQEALSKASEAMHRLHEVAGSFAEQYSAYRYIRDQLAGSTGTAALIDSSNRHASKHLKSKSSSASALNKHRQQCREQLQVSYGSVTKAVEELADAASAVTGLQELVQSAQQQAEL